MIDSRAGRVLEEGRRAMVDDAEWDWIAEHAAGGHDHLLIGTSLPWLLGAGAALPRGLERGRRRRRLGRPVGSWAGEKLRRANDLEHWAAFNASFERLAELQRSVGAGERGEAPASIVTLSGDVHHAYLFEVAFERGAGVRSHVFQAVCSPYRNPLDGRERRVIRALMTRGARGRHAHAGASSPACATRACAGARSATDRGSTTRSPRSRSTAAEIAMRLDKAVPVDEHDAELDSVLEHRLA